MSTISEIMNEVLELSRNDRSYLVSKLIESLDDDRELSPEWMDEITKRVARRESGESESIAREDLHREIEAILY